MPNFVHSDRGASFKSQELNQHLTGKGVATPITPLGLVSVNAAMALSGNPFSWSWNLVVQLNNIGNSPCQMLSTQLDHSYHLQLTPPIMSASLSTHGNSFPSWLMSPGPVLLRRFVRSCKNDPLVDQVELLDANPTYANIRYSNGRTLSIRDLAPSPRSKFISNSNQDPHDKGTASFHKQDLLSSDETNQAIAENYNAQEKIIDALEETAPSSIPRMSSRTNNPPAWYGWN